jgi:hypothetical protein
MSWLDELAAELDARLVPLRERRRILLELSDHMQCDSGCEARMGDPRRLAATFADELATHRSRRSALAVFGALAATAVALTVWQLMVARVGYPGFDAGLSLALFLPALVGIFIAPQVALVAGTLGAVRALRRRRARSLPAAEIALLHRRAEVALSAGFATVGGLGLYAVDFSRRLPAWLTAATAALAAAAALGLLAAARAVAHGRSLHPAQAGPAGDVYDDVPLLCRRWLRRRPWLLGAAASLAVGIGMTLFSAHAEHSLLEGLQRGAVEGLAAAAGFALLGRRLGLAPPPGD